MTLFAALFESGRIADLVIAVMVVEAIVLIFVLKRPALATVMTLLPGIFMILALRAAITGAGWEIVAALFQVSTR